MSSIRTWAVTFMIAFCMQAQAAERLELSEIIASCTGRLSAEMEFAWLMSDPEADQVEGYRSHFLEILESLRLRIPRDVSLVCFDDIDMFKHSDPPITAVAQPVEKMGQKAVEILLDKLKNGKKARKKDQVFLKTKVIPRRSCGSFLKI